VYNIAIEHMNVSEPSQTAKTRVKVVRTSSVAGLCSENSGGTVNNGCWESTNSR